MPPETDTPTSTDGRDTAVVDAPIDEIKDTAVEIVAETAVADEPAPEAEAQPEPEPEAQPEAIPAKAIALNDVVSAVQGAIWRTFDSDHDNGIDNYSRGMWPGEIQVYDGYAILEIQAGYWRVDYTIVDGRVILQPRAQWVLVEAEWVEAERMENTTIGFGDTVKALGAGIVGGYLIKFTDADHPDLEDDFFDAETDYGPHEKSLVYYHHGLDAALSVKRLGSRYAKGLASLKVDKVGVWIQHQLDLADEYEAALYQLTEMNKMGWSSGTASHLVRREMKTGANGRKSYHIHTWPLGLDASLTPQPAAGPEQTKVIPLKSYAQEQATRLPGLKALLQEVKRDASTSTSATANQPPAADPVKKNHKPNLLEDFKMEPEELKNLVTGAVQAAVAPMQAEVEALKAKLAAEPATNDTGFDLPERRESGINPVKSGSPAFDAVYVARFGEEDAAKTAVLTDVLGKNYKQLLYAQEMAFMKYLVAGERQLAADEYKLLQVQVFPFKTIMSMLSRGKSVAAVKDVMVEAQGSLGGFAVPPNMQAQIASRLPGLTAVRGGGARVINLTTGNGTEVVKYTGGDDRYRGAIRVQWGTETQDPAESNATLGLDRLDAHVMTFQVPMSRSLVEDAANLVDLVMEDIIDTIAMGEDAAFLTGDGAGKPMGWLPGSANTLSLTEVNSGHASTLLTAGIKALKRGVASQYRARGVWVGNSDTYSDIEALTASGTGSDFAFPDLSDNDQLLNRRALESEAMPDVAANAFPLLFADMSGYYIADREGVTIERFHDSNTGINKVEYHVRKRVGGRPVETWKAAVQKVAA